MPLWPFKKRRSGATNKDTSSSPLVTDTPSTPTRRSSTRFTQRLRRASQQTEKAAGIQSPESQQQTHSASAPAEQPAGQPAGRPRGSIEDVTALPASFTLKQSPHLRPIDSERPHIPYTFRDHATSQSSFQRPESRPATVRSKRSAFESIPVRRRSSKKRKDGDRVREEEIRAMSASSSVPKRPSESIFRRDSKKRRNVKGSTISLPYGESIHSMSTVPEQRGWELGIFDMFSPRPAIRLSGTPQYPGIDTYAPPASQDGSHKAKEKEPVEGFKKKSQRIGMTADDMDASDLRLLMERDAKRRERRKREQQEKLDRKLRAKAGRDRADSNKRRREAEEARREQDTRARVEEERRARQPLTPPTDVHPAFRGEPHLQPTEVVGLGIGQSQQPDSATQQQWKATEDPFSDSLASPPPDAQPQTPFEGHGPFTPIETPMEDPIVETAQAIRYSQHTPQQATPPQSPVPHAQQPTPSSPLSNNELRQERTASLPEPPPGMPTVLEERRGSEPRSIESKRAGGWATLFRRGGTKKQDGTKSPPSETSFTNTSRESMSRGPIPAHLLGGDRSPFQRNKAGTPTRTQSKFREDLPEMPMSPPDSRVQSPDVPDLPPGAAVTAAAYRGRASPRPNDRSNINSRSSQLDTGAPRYDTPVNPRAGLVSASLASVDSEGSWLASGGSLKRGSRSSQLSRSIGSLSKRPTEFVASFEDLGGQDKDAEYFARHTPNSDAKKQARGQRRASTPTITGADEESILGDSPADPAGPMTMHGSVRRKPTLVHRDPIARSREGLLAEFATGEVATIEGGGKDDEDFEMITPANDSQVRRATSVNYHDRGHARRVSAGEPKLLDVPPSRRQSVSPTERKRESSQSLSKMAS
ncbi:hypothetical protein Q7P37_007449 [Cladosporium fusiforme]